MSNIESTVLHDPRANRLATGSPLPQQARAMDSNRNLMPAISLTPQLFVRIDALDEIGMYVAVVEIGRLP